ncbi:Programmed cell death toxin MazF [Bathymodiolus heckerae thiotrophic gill symbiont]|uniref:type II toxin-antitoxin system PemK/MazF family toxin n=1 Tax=Bathymodiolus heckerae thiotrophic gill symbiont TaxID=1052212 RepID=UPI0010B0E0CE|nr:type II toxin-antitoxin system PemK/MazF family toxin [Bathymodiolus heckerae thiotrophic gill symbiont]SMN13580.1 Programmed cell death toxin MazF [Bathymodiolus heckerae thiotrophic gill symbiont]SMN16764.1 Programmed cell death toxin MazF [uncultured Candidatus Thioglobus sp.]
MNNYTPDRGDIVWLDFEPTKDREIGKYRPALILSSKQYAKKTGMVICSPISTSIRGGLTEVKINGLDKPSVVASTIVNTLSFRDRKAKLITKADRRVIDEVLSKLLPLLGA